MFSSFAQAIENSFLESSVRNYNAKKNLTHIDLTGAMETLRFEKLDKGGLVYMKDEAYPMRISASYEKVVTVVTAKKIMAVIANTIRDEGIFKNLFLVLGIMQSWQVYVIWIHNFLKGALQDNPDRYSQPVREMYRAFNSVFGESQPITPIMRMRDIVCAILEYDTAYRYRFQDIVSELNKENFNKNPHKELKRLISILSVRENVAGDEQSRLHGTLKILKIVPFFLLYLRIFGRNFWKGIQKIVNEMDINEIKPSVEDTYWMNKHTDYDFRGIDKYKRTEEYNNAKVAFMNNQLKSI